MAVEGKVLFLANLGRRVRNKRKALGLSLDDIAEQTGMAKTSIWQVEVGQSEPMARTLMLLSDVFQVSIDWIVTGRADRSERDVAALAKARELLKEIERVLP